MDAFRGTFPFARTDWDRPNTTQTASWTSTHQQQADQRVQLHQFAGRSVHQRVPGTDAFKRSKYGINYPYIFPANKEIPDKIPTITIDNFTEIDGGPYPSSSRGPIYTSTTTTYLKGRHTFKAGVTFEYSGEDDFDQINVQPIPGSTNNQNGRFEFTDARRPVRQHRRRHRERGDGAVHATTRRSASAPDQVARALDRHVRAGLVEAGAAT